MAVYQVRLVNALRNLDCTLAIAEDQSIWDQADESGIRLPAGCLQGECSLCVAKLLEGTVDQSEQRFLSPQEIAIGYIVTCVAYPRSDCVLETHQESVLYQSSLYKKAENSVKHQQ
jgi:ferredoxin